MSSVANKHGRRDGELRPPILMCVASSAGGVGALLTIFDNLPSDLHIAIILVQHLAPDRESDLPKILGWHTGMQVYPVRDGAKIVEGVIHVAPPDAHVLVRNGDTLELTHTDQVHHVRPAADLLLVSAAEHYSGPLIGVVLTGMGQDGSEGIQAVHRAGGIVIAQDPETAAYGSMPAAAIATGDVRMILPLDEIAPAIVKILESRAD